MKLSIIIPAYNEQENIAEIIKKIEATLDISYELVVVNDYSTDKTQRLVESLLDEYKNISLIDNKFEPGFANAIKTGFLSAKAGVVVPVMGDLCDDLETIKKMYLKIIDGYDIVCASRYSKGGRRLGGSKLKAFLSCWGGRSISYFVGIPTKDIANAFKMYKKKVIESIDIKSKGFEVSMELPIKAYYLGFKITEVPTTWRERTKGESSFKVFKLLPRYLSIYFWALGKRFGKKAISCKS